MSVSQQILVPADWSFIEVDENLLGFEIFFEAPGTEFTAEAGLIVAAPRRLHIGRLHVIDPDDSGAKGFHDAESFIDIAGPDGAREAVRRVVGDLDGVGFAFERND